MGNHPSSTALHINRKNHKTIELVRSDGTVQTLHDPLRAGQIVQIFPQHLVCHSESLYIGRKTPALSPNDQLKVGNKYFLLPEQFFTSALSLLSLASLTSPPSSKAPKAMSVSTSLRRIERASALYHPFEIEKNAPGEAIRIRVSTEFIRKLMEDRRLDVDGRGHEVHRDFTGNQRRLCNTPELQKAYEKLVTSRGQCWRLMLETIKEKEKVYWYKQLTSKVKDIMT